VSVPLLLVLSACILAMAILYSSVGHGGASGYIAILALFSLAPAAFPRRVSSGRYPWC
jgi:hypothetical protein